MDLSFRKIRYDDDGYKIASLSRRQLFSILRSEYLRAFASDLCCTSTEQEVPIQTVSRISQFSMRLFVNILTMVAELGVPHSSSTYHKIASSSTCIIATNGSGTAEDSLKYTVIHMLATPPPRSNLSWRSLSGHIHLLRSVGRPEG